MKLQNMQVIDEVLAQTLFEEPTDVRRTELKRFRERVQTERLAI